MTKMTRSEAGKIGGVTASLNRKNKYLKNPNKCFHCGGDLEYEKRKNKFCSHSCSASTSNKSNNRPKTLVPEIQICEWCGIDILKSKNIQRFCSRNCHRKHEWKKQKEVIESLKELPKCFDKVYGYNPKVGKRYLIETRGHVCEICRMDTWMDQPIPLVLDHISGDPTDNKIDNLRLVCGNCNMLLPTFAGRNRGKGRKSRYS